MEMSEKFNLAWQSFMSHGRELFKELRETQKYSDVTLVTEDLHQFNTHKFILSGCSKVFKEILDKNPLNSTIFLRGVKQKELESILEFVYLGKATIYQDRLKHFLNVAKDLNITELGDVASDDDDVKEDTNEKIVEDIYQDVSNEIQEDTVNEYKDNELEETEENDHGINKDKLDPKQNKEKEVIPLDSKPIDGLYHCDVCNKNFSNKYILKEHNEYHHLKVLGDAPFHCDICNLNFSSKGNLRKHNKIQHLKELYPCKQCDYQAPQGYNLQQHIQRKHEDIKYPCQECSYEGTCTSNLKEHLKSRHSTISK